MAPREVQYADHTHARIRGIDTSKARGAARRRSRSLTHEDVPDVRYGGFVQDRYLFAKDVVRFEGEVVAAVAALTAEIAAAAVDADRGRLRAAAGRHRLRGGARPTVRRSSTRLGRGTAATTTMVRDGNTLGHSTIVKGDADAAMATPTSSSRAATSPTRSQGVPIEPRAIVAQWQGDKVTIWSSTQVPFAARAASWHDARDPRVATCASSCRCWAAASARKCDFHFEAHVAALARAARAAGEAGVLARARSSSRPTSAARAW